MGRCVRIFQACATVCREIHDIQLSVFPEPPVSSTKRNGGLWGRECTTTHSHIQEKSSLDVEKQSDVIHTKRSLITQLYKLKSRAKFPGCSPLLVKEINYLGECFGYCVAHNKDNPDSHPAGINTHLVKMKIVANPCVNSRRTQQVINSKLPFPIHHHIRFIW